MKKIIAIVLSVALAAILAVPAFALPASTVTLSEVSGTSDSVSFSGMSENVKAAVMVQVLDSQNQIVGMESFLTAGDGGFGGTIGGLSLEMGEQYTVRAADYDGGTWDSLPLTMNYSYAVEKPVEPGNCELILNKISAGVYDIAEKDGGFTLAMEGKYLVFRSTSHKLTTSENEEDATVWKYNGGLYVEVPASRRSHGGFFRHPRTVQYFLSCEKNGRLCTHLTFVSAKVVGIVYTDVAPVTLTFERSAAHFMSFSRRVYAFRIENVSENAKVQYNFGYTWGSGCSFTMRYRPSSVLIRVTENHVTTTWKATLYEGAYTMTLLQ